MKIKNLRWYIIILVMLGTVTNYLARSTLGVAAPEMMKTLGLSSEQYSWIVSVFPFTYAIGGILCGFVIDRYGLRLSFAILAALWSIFNMLTGLCSTWLPIAWLRGGLGITEAAFNPAGMKVTAEWFPAKERGLACGVYSLGTSLGAMLAPPLVVWAIVNYNWEMSFVVTGGVGLIWCVLWLVCYRPPEKHPAMIASEYDAVLADQIEVVKEKASLRSIIKNKSLWAISLPRFMADPAWGTLHYWMPLYLVTVRHMNLQEIAMFAWLPFLTADLGCLCAGFMSRILVNRGVSVLNSKRITFTFAALLMLSMAGVGFVTNVYIAIALFCVAGFAHQCLSITVISMSSDLFSKHEVATATGFAAFTGSMGNFLFGLFLGAMVAVVGYNVFFVGLGIFDLIGAMFLWLLIKNPQQKTQTVAA
ncbi:hexuronate transporter [Trabulsiella guamensis ATCC 49490]|uniref:Hexuronate transporter n=1 Tax=Trabulsiella guamensis ATCC 49490 TaxID=1005994 RepID=A0A085A7K8_9ENTR|nr:MFS transporter [Trabulsiella guamensis]KFC06203.1 hexuronate transporter [Trabulsiella guamensis ATCC 49490]